MPIDIEEFEEVDDDREKSTSELIVEFLLEHDDEAFERSEIADAIDTPPNTTGTNLSRLKDRGLVRHRGTYWAITDDLHLLAHEMRHSDALARLRDRFGPTITSEEAAREWSDAQPDRPHPSNAKNEDDEAQIDLLDALGELE